MRRTFILGVALFLSVCSFAQNGFVANYDEARIVPYNLPDVCTSPDGTRATSAKQWQNLVRPSLLNTFGEECYGFMPQVDVATSFKVVEESDDALNGLAIRRQVEMTFERNGMMRKALMLILLPKAVKKVPVFVAMNFQGNATTIDDPAVIESQYSTYGRMAQVSRWNYDLILKAGYGVATMHYYDIYVDTKDGFDKSILPLFGYASASDVPSNGPGSIAAWAWGYSRMVDYLCTLPQVDTRKIICQGHSRLGKTALWAGVLDSRMRLVISNESGCMGAAISRRAIGETVGRIVDVFPWWFCRNIDQYKGREYAMPVDQHQLISLVAPRPVYVCSAQEDRWADPKGEYMAAKEASRIYNLYGRVGLENTEFPAVNSPLCPGWVGYHIRTGKHDVTDFDWESYIAFANQCLK